MDDLEKLEEELKKQYDLYLERFRNLDYLELQLDIYNQEEKEKLNTAERNLKRMQERLRKQDEHLNRGTKAIESAYHNSKAGIDGRNLGGRGAERPVASYLKYRDGSGGGKGSSGRPERGKGRVVGDITGGGHTDSSGGSLTNSETGSDSGGSDSEGWGQVSLGGNSGSHSSDSESVIDDALDDDGGDLSVSDENDYVSDDSDSDGF